jgi:predicted  nucleic acid-binding Zn-ribbon protein
MAAAPDAPHDIDGEQQPAEVAPTISERLLALQVIDTESDQLRTRLERLDERAEQQARAAAVAEWERATESHERRIVELTAAIEAAERLGEEHDVRKERFGQQLKTIIAPREAEALMHEIEMLDAQRDANETAELEALEELSSIESALVAHRGEERGHRDALASADEALARTVSEIDEARTALEIRRGEARGEIDDATMRSYDRIRAHLGVAVARLEGKMCSGCHLDLSAAEIDTVREDATLGAGASDCPQCGRILVP